MNVVGDTGLEPVTPSLSKIVTDDREVRSFQQTSRKSANLHASVTSHKTEQQRAWTSISGGVVARGWCSSSPFHRRRLERLSAVRPSPDTRPAGVAGVARFAGPSPPSREAGRNAPLVSFDANSLDAYLNSTDTGLLDVKTWPVVPSYTTYEW